MRRTFCSLAVFGFTLFLATPASAASFDCSRARAAEEVTICNSPSLSGLDSEMGAYWHVYSRAPMAMSGNIDRAERAQAFLMRRHACGRNVACLTALYGSRIAELRREVDDMVDDYVRRVNG
jgi:uncharacterized protein